MSMEHAEMRPEDQEAAMSLLNENPFLQDDEYAKRVVETGKADSGVEVDLGNFLAVRAAILEKAAAEEKLKKLEKLDPTAYIAAVSVRGDMEQYIN